MGRIQRQYRVPSLNLNTNEKWMRGSIASPKKSFKFIGMTKNKNKKITKYDSILVTKENFEKIIGKSVATLPEIVARNKRVHKQIIKAIKEKPGYKNSKEGQFATRDELLELMPDYDEQTMTSALIDFELKMIDSIGTLHFPYHFFNKKKPSKKKAK